MKRNTSTVVFVLASIFVGIIASWASGSSELGVRKIISLDGRWQIAEGTLADVPARFEHEVNVPGLVDMAQPAFLNPGVREKDTRRDAFWYRRTFNLESISDVAMLKVGKAMFGTRVILNGQALGDHLPCFTPGFFDARHALKIGENELLIRIGADRSAVGRAIPSGLDFEKVRYIPGIFDSVELILSGTPHIINVQAAPDITHQQAHVRFWLDHAREGQADLEVHEAKSGKIVGKVSIRLTHSSEQVVEVTVPIAHCHLWSPESPFLYNLTVHTEGDEFSTRFGMREFRLDPVTGRAVLNGKPYFMRGSNITLYRFFEDPDRGQLPWDEQWVRKLHQRIKDMHWNSLRYCIGFPPEMWYRIADEEGILIQDEFPIWYGDGDAFPSELKSDELATEYGEWMRERWNHPCVVIWDSGNETLSSKVAPAIQQVRDLDLSLRPWDNSYNYPMAPGDCFESHPYHFFNPKFTMADLATADPIPQALPQHNDSKHAVIINEYGWLWLNRDGTPTTLTTNLYRNLLGTNSTTEQRRHLYARCLAAETEFWRIHRKVAGVLHFTTLSYSRPDGQTSDHWLDVKELKWEPEFYRYVKDAFAPVGLSLNFWSATAIAGHKIQLRVTLINDLGQRWNGPVMLRVKCADRVPVMLKQKCHLDAYGTETEVFDLTWPETTGPCLLEAELHGFDGNVVRSVRELEILPAMPSEHQ